MPYRPPTEPTWTFLTNHAHVLLCLARDPTLRIRDIADLVGITERTTSAILDDLEHTGYLTRHRVGRRSHYTLSLDLPLRHPLEQDHVVGELLNTLAESRTMPPTERAVVGATTVNAGGATPTRRARV
ncbi:MAG: helix-turn-helix transcriptional regulator [Acidimicrobiales bacterium]